MEIKTIEEAKDAIAGWLKDNEHQCSPVPDDNANFHYEIDYPIGSMKRQRVIQPNEYKDLILVLNGVAIADEHKAQLEEMSEEERDIFYEDIRGDLLFLDNSFDMNTDDKGVVQQVQFSYEFYFDALTKTQLYKALLLNHRTLLYIVTAFNKRFGIPEMPEQTEGEGEGEHAH
ncbi:MAG: DUF2299 family protein [Deltaproteobacteria bacterium]|nr:DUF2299 family protein [Deltaproteobacteria bacterium]